jgi:hypothetical protein
VKPNAPGAQGSDPVSVFLAVMVFGLGIAGALALSGVRSTHSSRDFTAALQPDGSCPGPGSAWSIPDEPQWTVTRCSDRPGWVIRAPIVVAFFGTACGASLLVRRVEVGA